MRGAVKLTGEFGSRISKGGLSMERSRGIWRELDLFDARRLVSRTEYANWKGDW